uniref:Uncharacterized protein n=1 Tax=Anopheles dirus TaxID=7168 RepID=A0A182N7L7_9DIPT
GPTLDGPPANGKQNPGREQITPQEATLVVPLGGSATAISTDSLLGDGRPMGQPPSGQNVVSPSVMAKFLEDELKSSDALLGTPLKHCDTCVCTHGPAGPTLAGETRLHATGSLLLADLLGSEQKYYSVATQTLIKGETNNSLCLRCSSNLNSPSHNNSPYMMKLIKSSDSVISETKSSVSDYLTTPDKVSPTGGGVGGGANGTTLVTHCDTGSGGEVDASEPLALLVSTKKDDLMVNPILGHHRLAADRAASLSSSSADQHLHHHQQQQLQQQQLQQHGKLPTKLAPSQQHMKKAGLSGDSAFKQSKPPVCGGPVQMTAVNRTEVSAPSQPKFSHDSPSYIIKDTDQMSGSHATPISSTGGNGALGQSGKYGTSASGSVGSGLYHTVGSTNSLWSRTSSKDPEKDGAKMFEIFNRNLIKTIKAENPKMSGPRICALRIQNGSSNILLDNLVDDSLEGLDSKPPTPVMYTRRSKFLDEELLLDDDPSIGLNGAIKTTNLPTATSSGDSIPPTGFGSKSLLTPSKSSQQAGAAAGTGDGGADGHGNFISGTINRVDEGGGGEDDGVGPGASKQVCNMSTTTSPHSSDRLCTIGEEVSNLLINTKLGSAALPKPRLDISVNKLEGIDMTSKKSCTQSSSISSEIDIQESAILRRQQLSRVAEWVQNNSKIGNTEPLSNTESDNEPTAGLATSDSLNNNAAASAGAGHGAHLPKASARSSVLLSGSKGVGVGGCESKAPTASDIKVGRHSYGPSIVGSNLLNNNNNNNNNSGPNSAIGYGNTSFAQHGSTNTSSKPSGVAGVMHGYNNNLNSSLTITSGASGLDYNSNSTITAGSTLGAIRKGSSMLRADSTLTECLMDEVNRLSVDGDPDPIDQDDDSSSVDLAQMEYNVKQFLLKQNEWSTVHTRRQSLISSSASSVKGGGGGGARVEERPVRDPCKGLFPGMAVAQQTAPTYHHHHGGVTGGPASSTGNPAYGNSY